MAQTQVETESSARCRPYFGKQVDGTVKLPNSILATCYALNTSNTKRIIVGFEDTNASSTSDSDVFKYEIVLKFINAGGPKGQQRELVMNRGTWDKLQENFDLISTYFTDDYQYYEKYGGQRVLTMDNYELFFTTSYGSKAFMLEQRARSFEELTSFTQTQDQENKKMKLYLPSIVMQRVTFEGVKTVSKCIDAQITRLEVHEKNIDACAVFMKEYIRDILQERFSSEADRKNLLYNALDFKNFINDVSVVELLYNKIKQNLPNDFTERYFNIVFEEMLAFNLLSMMEKIRKEMFPN